MISRQVVGGMQHRLARAIFFLAVWFSLAMSSAVCAAGGPPDEQLYDIDIPPLNAAEALNLLAEQTGAIMLFPYDLAEARQANAVLGRLTLMDALGELLDGSGLSGGLSDKSVIQIALDELVERNKEEGKMAIEKVPFRRKVGTFFASLLIASGAGAQDAADSQGDEASIEEITVTGSRLKRDSFNVSTPLVSVDSEAISDTGLTSLAQVLIDEIPALYESQSNSNSQSQIGNTGVTSVNLRRLGTNRTLTLIDGRRTVQTAYGSRNISLNTIPAGFVERVEVITGGSTAAYGSDAIAGVINVITEPGKVGFGFDTQGGYATDGGAEELSVSADYGMNFSDGRGFLFVAASYAEQRGISPTDRDRANLETDFDYNNGELCNEWATASGDQCERDITSADWRNRSDNMPGGVFEEGSSNPVADGGFWYDLDGVLQTGWVEDRDGFNVNQFELLRVPDEQTAAAAKIEYEFSEKTKGYFQLHYSRNTSFNTKTPENYEESDNRATIDPVTGDPGFILVGAISITNPFVPPIIAANSGSSISWDRLMVEVGQITTDNTRTTWRSWGGLQGSMFNDNWDWDVSAGYSRFEQDQIRSNEIDVLRTQQALDAGFAADGVTIQCNDAAARAAGCVPLNLFGVGSVTPEMADWIRVNPIINPTIDQINVLGFISGELFDMPAGPVGAVFGAEYTRDEIDLLVSDGLAFGGVTFNIVPPIKGDIDVAELFSEVSFPLASNLTADVSARVSDYSPKNVGTLFSYTGGLIWEPVDGYILRGNYARAQRAPDLTELLSKRRGDFDNIDDICDGATATSTEAGHANCRLDPAVAAVIAADGEFEDDNVGYGPAAGNPDLTEETADTYTIGFSIAPSFLEGFRLAVDYYDITIEDAITEYGHPAIFSNCYDSSITFGDPNFFCDFLTRDSDGQITESLQPQFNLDELSTSGYDVALDYLVDLESNGSLQLTAHYTHIIDHDQKFIGVDGPDEVDNMDLNNGIFSDVATASLTWRSPEHWRARWRTAYQGSIIDDPGRVADHLERFAANDALCAASDPGCITNPEVPNFLYYGSYIRHDLSLSYDTVLTNGAGLNLHAGVRNVFDDMGPLIPRTGDSLERGVGGFDSKYDGGLGRFAYLGVGMRFDD